MSSPPARSQNEQDGQDISVDTVWESCLWHRPRGNRMGHTSTLGVFFFGTIPIVKSSPLDVLLVQAHVPVVILDDWSELCTFNATEVRNTFGGWMQRAHEWLKPGLWLPRNQDRMEALCDATILCRRVYEERKRLLQKWKAPVVA
jgi:hypothetical protein